MTDNFYIYDSQKVHGYMYSPIDKLYHKCDRYSHKKHVSNPVFVYQDLRLLMNVIRDAIPINNDKILIPSTNKYRQRNQNDYFTYAINPPVFTNNVHNYIVKLIPDDIQYNKLKQHIFNSLTMYTPKSYIIIRGDGDGMNTLFKLLSTLDPLITMCKKTVYCEPYVNNVVLDVICQSRIVLCNIGDKTVRIAEPNKSNKYPIQYHGIIYQTPYYSKEDDEKIIYIKSTSSVESFTSGEILGWVLS